MGDIEIVAEGLAFSEAPRWHEGRLWFSEMEGRAVHVLGDGGRLETVCEVEGKPSGLGWLPDGRMLVVSMDDQRLLRIEGAKLVLHADLSGLATGPCNELVVGPDGAAYAGNFGAGAIGSGEPAALIRVTPDGEASIAADGLVFPNGMGITSDRRTLVVAETFANRLTAFSIEADGSLSGRRTFADLGELRPDGICLDAEGAAWVGALGANAFVRVRDGGEVAGRVEMPGYLAIACMLGGEDRRTLYMVAAGQGARTDRVTVIARTEVDVPGAGWP